ncbi:phosphotransferase [Bifidobacterium moraviense]|uniref:phosphotransferase n=1 Tax=Bifidobacterium moraviense TaxID=2675323 RepID=UPI00145F5D6B
MTFSSYYTLAALASAAAPGLTVTGVRDGAGTGDADAALGIRNAVIQDGTGHLYDVVAADGDKARTLLKRRVKAARTLAEAKEPAGLSFGIERVLKFVAGDEEHSPTGGTALLIMQHVEGVAKPLETLTTDECSSVGTAIGAIHRLRGTFLTDAKYPSYSTEQIHAQLIAWIARLKQAGHVPPEITSSWSRVVETEGLWDFATCPVHGGFDDGDLLFSGSGLTAVHHWQSMQINDPARDLAWIFGKLDETHRNAVIAAYGRMMGSRLDDLIMLRANLWLQMEQVGDFIDAIDRADNARIIQFKAQVERLAHQLAMLSADSAPRRDPGAARGNGQSSSTITVGTLLGDAPARGAARPAPAPETAVGMRSATRTTVPLRGAYDDIRPNTPRVPTMPDVPVANVVHLDGDAAGTMGATGAIGRTGAAAKASGDAETVVIPAQSGGGDAKPDDMATVTLHRP